MSCRIALDNDIVAKFVAYDLEQELVAVLNVPREQLGVLGTLVFAISPSRLRSARDRGGPAHRRLKTFAQSVEILEPTDEEGRLAATIEQAAQECGVDLDVGESQLAAISIIRSIHRLCTGDKRAICALENLRRTLTQIAALDGRIVPLEAIAVALVEMFGHDSVRSCVCGSQGTDGALEVCFQCHNGVGQPAETLIGLDSYLGALASRAPKMLSRLNGGS